MADYHDPTRPQPIPVPAPPAGRVTLEFTKNANLPIELGGKTVYAMALPTNDPKLAGMWALFPDDRTWQERVATNQEYFVLVHYPSGGSVVKAGKIIGKIPELGDQWVYRTSLEWVMRSYAPDIVRKEEKGRA